MACDITTGRGIPCLNAKPGIDRFYLIPRTELGKEAFTISGGEVTGLDTSITEVFKFDIRGDDENVFNNNKPETGRSSGATTYNEEFIVKLAKVDKETTQELDNIAKSTPNVVVKDNNGNYRLMGLSEGTYLNIQEASGGAKTDFNGYTLTFTATEFEPAPFVDESTITSLEGLVSETNITP